MDNIITTTIERQIFNCIKDDITKLNLLNKEYIKSDMGINLYNSFKDVFDKGLQPNIDNLLKHLRVYDNKIERNDLNFLNETTYHKDEFTTYLKEIKKIHYINKLEDLIVDKLLLESGKKNFNLDNIKEIQEELNNYITEIDKDLDYKLLNAEEEMEEIEKHIKERYLGKKYPSGDIHLDKHLYNSSLQPGELSIVCGPSGCAKTTYVNNLVEKRRFKNLPTLHIPLEMGLEPTLDSKLGIRTQLDRNNFTFDVEESKEMDYEKILEKIAIEKIRAKKIKRYIHLSISTLNIPELIYFIEVSKKKMGLKKEDYLLCIIDLGTMLEDFNKSGSNKANDYEHAMNKLLATAKSLNSHIMLVAQIKRPKEKVKVEKVEDVEKFRPTRELLKNSAELENRARLIIGLFRRTYFVKTYLPDDPFLDYSDDILESQILKQNMGDVGSFIKYLFNERSSELYFYKEKEDAER